MASRAATPARTTRSRARAATPLPAVPNKRSHAYGAPGKAEISSQVTASQADIDQAFAASREDPAVPEKAPSPRPQQSGPNGVAAGGMAATNSVEIRPETRMDLTSYRRPDQRPEAHQKAEPSWFRVLFYTVPDFVASKQFLLLFLLVSWLTTMSWVSMGTFVCGRVRQTALNNSTAERICYHAGQIAGYDLRQITEANMETQLDFNKVFWYTSRDLTNEQARLRNETNELSSQVGFLNDTVTHLQSILPNYMVVEVKDGKATIPAQFWEALASKMQSDEGSVLWRSFLETNEAQMKDFFDETARAQVDNAVAKHKLVPYDQFTSLLAKNNDFMETKFNDTLRTFQTIVLQEARQAAQEVAEDIFERAQRLAKGQISALAYSNLIANMDERMRETNYFSLGLGAIVQPHYTSPTWREASLLQSVGRKIWRAIGMETQHAHLSVKPSTEALTQWSENGDCWCAASPVDSDIKAQIAVRMPLKIHPTRLAIEHIPASGTRDIASAPKDFEVWIKMESSEGAEKVKQALNERTGRFWPDLCGDPPKSTSSSNEDEGSWVCVGQDKYDIHFHNYLQTTILPINPWDIGLETWVVVVKVLSNWGADHTCLYRVRLTGQEVR